MAKPIIDVSEHNGILNWDLMKDQIDGAIAVDMAEILHHKMISSMSAMSVSARVYKFLMAYIYFRTLLMRKRHVVKQIMYCA